MTIRNTRWVVGFVLLALLVGCGPVGERQAEQLARKRMRMVIGEAALARARVEVRSSRTGWMVIFRDARASCDEASLWRGACRFGPMVYRDVYACVERGSWVIGQVGGSSQPLGPEDRCTVPVPSGPAREVEPTLEPAPSR